MRTLIDRNSFYKGLKVELREEVLEKLEQYPKSKRGKYWNYCPGFATYVPTFTEALDHAVRKVMFRMETQLRGWVQDKVRLTICIEDDENEFIAELGILEWRVLRRDKYRTHTDLYIHVVRKKPDPDEKARRAFERNEYRELCKRVDEQLKQERRSKSKKR